MDGHDACRGAEDRFRDPEDRHRRVVEALGAAQLDCQALEALGPTAEPIRIPPGCGEGRAQGADEDPDDDEQAGLQDRGGIAHCRVAERQDEHERLARQAEEGRTETALQTAEPGAKGDGNHVREETDVRARRGIGRCLQANGQECEERGPRQRVIRSLRLGGDNRAPEAHGQADRHTLPGGHCR